MIVIFRGKDTLKNKIEIIFQLPIVDDEYKVEQKLEGGKKIVKLEMEEISRHLPGVIL